MTCRRSEGRAGLPMITMADGSLALDAAFCTNFWRLMWSLDPSSEAVPFLGFGSTRLASDSRVLDLDRYGHIKHRQHRRDVRR
jgi:hypothetical protein